VKIRVLLPLAATGCLIGLLFSVQSPPHKVIRGGHERLCWRPPEKDHGHAMGDSLRAEKYDGRCEPEKDATAAQEQ